MARSVAQGTDDWSQAKQRRGQTMKDQHGRDWWCSIEIKSGDPTGIIIPRFTAPWRPPQSALKMVPNQPYSLRIDYAELKIERREALRNYEKEVARQCAARQWPLPDLARGEIPSVAIQELVGPRPEPVEVILAAEQGNRWILGLTPTPDQRLAPYFEKPTVEEPDFSDTDYSEIEESTDPEALGGKVVKVGDRNRRGQFVAKGAG